MYSFFIGNLGTKSKSINGQVSKSIELLNLLSESKRIVVVDTDNFLTFRRIIYLFNVKEVNVVLGFNGLTFFLPILFFIKKYINNYKLNIFLVGGWIEEFLSIRKYYWKYFAYSVTYVESSEIAERLSIKGLNVYTFPNFRILPLLSPKNLVSSGRFKFRFCFISRIIESKGVLTAINLVNEMGRKGIPVLLDFYGPIDPKMEDMFNSMLSENIRYIGCITSSKDVLKTLTDYDFSVLPTKYSGECIPGIVIESMMAGTPAIVTDFKYLKELVLNGVNGFIFNEEIFITSVISSLENLNDDGYKKISSNCISFVSQNQSVDVAKRILDI